MNSGQFSKENARIVAVPNGKVIYLDAKDAEDLEFVREAYGFKAEEKRWFRERDRLFLFMGALTEKGGGNFLKPEHLLVTG